VSARPWRRRRFNYLTSPFVIAFYYYPLLSASVDSRPPLPGASPRQQIYIYFLMWRQSFVFSLESYPTTVDVVAAIDFGASVGFVKLDRSNVFAAVKYKHAYFVDCSRNEFPRCPSDVDFRGESESRFSIYGTRRRLGGTPFKYRAKRIDTHS